MSTLIGRVVKKLSKIEDIPFVNSGGCAIVASELYKYVKAKDKRFSPAIVYLRSNVYYEARVSGGRVSSCAHALVKIGGMYYDTRGAHTLEDLQDNWGMHTERMEEVSLDYVEESLKLPHWNSLFDRVLHVPTIKVVFSTSKKEKRWYKR